MKNWQLTKEDYLKNLYYHMKERVNNPAKSRNLSGKRIRHYFRLPICSFKAFMEFALNNKNFDSLFLRYKQSRGTRKLAPSIDRVNNKRGYVLGNMQFLTTSDNVKKDSHRKWIFLRNSRTGKIFGFSKTKNVSNFLSQKGRVNLKHKSFTDMTTGVKYINITSKRRKI